MKREDKDLISIPAYMNSDDEEVELMDPSLASNSILRVLLSEASQSSQHSTHTIKLLNCLARQGSIDRKELNDLVFKGGITDEIKGLRPIVWRVLLNYLPDTDTKNWEDHLRTQKANYEEWLKELITQPEVKQKEAEGGAKKMMDHPLSLNNNSEWKKFYSDKLLWEEIEKDVKRTRQEVAFFHMAIDPTKNTEVDRLMK